MKKILSTRVLVKICVLTTILLVLIIYTIWGNSALMVSMVNISSDRIASAFSNFRIAQVSDLHNAEFGESNTELIELLSEHEPDIIVITGDLIDAGHTDIEIAFDFIKQAVQIAPVYFVTGNHEANFSHYDQFKTGLEASDVTVLEDEAIQLVHNNEMITLIGLSDSDFTIKGDMFNEAPAMVNTKLNSLIDDENSYTTRLNAERAELANGVDNEHPALVAFMKYQNIEALNREILVELVDYIKVYENGNISVKFKFADELRKIAEYIEINTTEDTAVAG